MGRTDEETGLDSFHLHTATSPNLGGDPGPSLASVSPSGKPEQCASMSKTAARRDGDEECKLPAPHKANIQSISFVPVGRGVVSAL